MAHIDVDYLDYLVTVPDTGDNSLSVSAPLDNETVQTFVLTVVTGNIQFCAGQPVGANSPVHGADSKVVFTNLKTKDIYFKGGSGDTFIIGF